MRRVAAPAPGARRRLQRGGFGGFGGGGGPFGGRPSMEGMGRQLGMMVVFGFGVSLAFQGVAHAYNWAMGRGRYRAPPEKTASQLRAEEEYKERQAKRDERAAAKAARKLQRERERAAAASEFGTYDPRDRNFNPCANELKVLADCQRSGAPDCSRYLDRLRACQMRTGLP